MTFDELIEALGERLGMEIENAGGATLALDPDTSCLHLQKYNWLERLDAEGAFNMMESFASTVDAWRRIVADYRPPATESSGPGALDSGSLMQV